MTDYDEYWDIPDEIRQQLVLVGAIFMAKTGASVDDVQGLMSATVKIYIRWLEMKEKEQVH